MFFQRDVAKFQQSLTFFLQNAPSKTLHFLCFLRKKAKRSNVFLQFHKKILKNTPLRIAQNHPTHQVVTKTREIPPEKYEFF